MRAAQRRAWGQRDATAGEVARRECRALGRALLGREARQATVPTMEPATERTMPSASSAAPTTVDVQAASRTQNGSRKNNACSGPTVRTLRP
jgi:hypothetical protein